MLRLSSYAVSSKRMKKGGYALLSGLTGAIDVIDDGLNGILRKKTNGADHREIYFEKDELPDDIEKHWLERGYITELSHEEEKERIALIADIVHERLTERPGIVIVPDSDCNYRCVYCFEKHLQTGKNEKTLMDEDEVEWIYKAVEQFGNVKNSNITLFGGEPLSAASKDVIFKLVNMGTAKGFTFFAVTNGHDLDMFTPLLGTGKISDIQITMDGPKSAHDKRRITLDGSSSYDKLIANMRKAMSETDIGINIRVNTDEKNIDVFGELIEAFDSEGWMDSEKFSVNAAIVYLKNKNGEVLPSQDISSINNKLRKYAENYKNVTIGSAQTNKNQMIFNSLANDKPFNLRTSFCAAASGMYIFAPGGKIYSCWESLGRECSEIGSYSADGMVIDPVKSSEWFGRNAALIPECLECKYCLICAGGCPQYALYNSKSLYKPFCDDFGKSYDWVLADAVEKYLSEQGL